MAGKKKELLKVIPYEQSLEIHIYGDILENSVFQKIIEVMKENRECEAPKSVRFVVFTSMMMVSVRYAFPSQFYESVEVRRLEEKKENEVLRDAAGL